MRHAVRIVRWDAHVARNSLCRRGPQIPGRFSEGGPGKTELVEVLRGLKFSRTGFDGELDPRRRIVKLGQQVDVVVVVRLDRRRDEVVRSVHCLCPGRRVHAANVGGRPSINPILHAVPANA